MPTPARARLTIPLLIAASLFVIPAVAAPPMDHLPGASPGHTLGLVPYDIRTGNAPTMQRLAELRATPAAAARFAAGDALTRRIPGVVVSMNDLLLTPDFIRATESMLTPAAVGAPDPAAIVKGFITRERELFSIAPEQIDAARISRDGVTRHNGVRTVWWQQEIDGLPIVGCDLRANILPDGRLASIGSRMLPQPVCDAARLKRADLNAAAAVLLAADAAEIVIDAAIELAPAEADGARVEFPLIAGMSRAPVAERVYFPAASNDVRPAWRVTVSATNDPNVYEIIIDADTGEVLSRTNNTWYGGDGAATYRVWTNDSPAPMTPGPASPDGTQAPIVPRELITLSALDSFASPLGWIDAGLNETFGNNVAAHADADGNNFPDLPRPQGSPFRVFDFPIDLSQQPSTFRDASIVQGFFTANWHHDVLHGLGFDEPFANFQQDNFGRGGVGGDRINLDMQDGAGTNNANFSSGGSDGSSARVQMFIFTGPNPDIDGGLDSQILIHELAHGTSIRLHGGLGGTQGSGMGEGWSDYFAVALLLEPGDDLHGTYPVAGYSTLQGFGQPFFDNYYFGIRRFPYTTDLGRNPLTFGDISPDLIDIDPLIPINPVFSSTNPSQVHNVGTVWCSILWECTVAMIEKHGFEAGQDLILRLVIDGMKLTTTSTPSMVQARDAILLADRINNNGDNNCDLWAAFAKRGLGAGAFSATSGVSNIGESFDIPIGVEFAIDGGAPDRTVAGAPAAFDVTVADSCGEPLTPGSARLVVTINGGAPLSLPFAAGLTEEQFAATLPPFACGDTVTYYLAADTGDQTWTFPANAPADQIPLLVFTDDPANFEDDFETDQGWFVFGSATAGHWQRGVPAGFGDRGDPVTDADGSGAAYLTENGPGNTDVDNGDTVLLSPAFDATGDGDAHLEYFIWFSNDLGTNIDDVLVIELSPDNGGVWLPVETIDASTFGWERRLVRIADIAEPQSAMRLRVIASDLGAPSVVEAGFDGFRVVRFECNTAAIPADINGDGVVNGVDLLILLSNWQGPGATDLNGDGATDGLDLLILLSNWTG